jgi:prepilin-type processing-associated H-X9-DG protein
MGSWFIYDPITGQGGDGALPVNCRLTTTDITDGTSNTLGMAEVKAYTPYLRDGGNPNGFGVAALVAAKSSLMAEASKPIPVIPNGSMPASTRPDSRRSSRPNKVISTARNELRHRLQFFPRRTTTNRQTYAAVTARSYHGGGLVNVLLMDGSVRSVSNSITLTSWRALARNGGEVCIDY